MKIVLVCAGGMSTSLIVEAVKKEMELRKLEGEVQAISLSLLPKVMREASCVLVAPQVRHRLKGILALGEEAKTPVGLIDAAAYGRVDGKTVLEQALKLIQPTVFE